MKFRVEFETDNAAFEDSFTDEVLHVLSQITGEALINDSGRLRDSNGNTVGKWFIK